MNKVFDLVDKTNEMVYKAASWIILPLFLGLFYEVVARYFFNAPTVWAYDLTYMLYGTMFVLGSPHVLRINRHIRVDLFYEKFSEKKKRVVDLVLYLVFFFPATIALFIKSIDYTIFAWKVGEKASSGAWRPSLVPLRLVFSVALFLLLAQGIVCFIRILLQSEVRSR
jgi:TRAP-type mannitol/chloroaromatic compound transport system permease small subunit